MAPWPTACTCAEASALTWHGVRRAGIAKGQLYGAAFLDHIIPILSLGYEVVDKMCEKRKTSARHLHNHRGLPFPFGLQLDADERGAPCLRPSDPKHGAVRMMSRLSVLLMCGPNAADELARAAGLPVEEVRGLCASPGKSCAHLDGNDTGAGHRRHSYIPWGSRGEVTYIYGDEGLEDGSCKGMDLWHMVLIISCELAHNIRTRARWAF